MKQDVTIDKNMITYKRKERSVPSAKDSGMEITMLEQLGTFLEYRRLLLYTVLQGWLSNDKDANDAFMSMIENPCKLDILLGRKRLYEW